MPSNSSLTPELEAALIRMASSGEADFFPTRRVYQLEDEEEEVEDNEEVEDAEDEIFALDASDPEPPPIPRAAPRFGQTLSQILNRGSASFTARMADPEPIYQEDDDSTYAGDDMLVGPHFGNAPDRSTLSGHPMVVGTNRVGIEIELENITSGLGRSSQYWKQIPDGSLRNNGAEFIFRTPLGGIDLFNATVEIDTHLHKLNPDGSQRCSTHVHVDVRDMNVDQLKRLILAYTMYERILFKCSGWHRYKNNFCVALGFAQNLVRILSEHWSAPDNVFLENVTRSWDKYSSINLLPMMDKGSVEFRISEAKWRKGQLLRLCNRFLSLKEVAMSWTGTNQELVEHLLSAPVASVLRKSLPRGFEGQPSDLELGMKLSYDIMHLSKMPQPVAEMSESERLAHSISEVYDPENGDVQFTAPSHDAAWQHVRGQWRRSNLRYRSRMVLPVDQPSLMTFSFIHKLSSYYELDYTWFIRGTELREAYRNYRDNHSE